MIREKNSSVLTWAPEVLRLFPKIQTHPEFSVEENQLSWDYREARMTIPSLGNASLHRGVRSDSDSTKRLTSDILAGNSRRELREIFVTAVHFSWRICTASEDISLLACLSVPGN